MTTLTVLGIIFGALILLFVFLFFFKQCVANKLNSTKEEKIGLTKLKGHYDANGVLIMSEDEFHISSTGSFKRFDPVDNDLVISTHNQFDHEQESNLKNNQLFQSQHKNETNNGETSISPIPRPVSSINVSTLTTKSQFSINPPPGTQQQSRNALAVLSNQPQIESDVPEDTEVISAALQRALSCESVCSDTSVVLGDLEEPHITGYLCIGLEYDSEYSNLVVNILEAKDLISPTCNENQLDTYVRIFLLPEKDANIQTKMYRSNRSPSYKERFLFSLNPREQSQRSLNFHVYSVDHLNHTLIGEGELRLCDLSMRQPVTTWITLTDNGQIGTEFGELMFSISYLPTAERLTVVVVKARSLKFEKEEAPGNLFVKVYIMQHGKKIFKKKTSLKKPERSPIFNEAMIFSVPAHSLQTIQLRLTVSEVFDGDGSSKPIGHVIIGAQGTGRSLNHWKQMLIALRKPVAMWHPLRK